MAIQISWSGCLTKYPYKKVKELECPTKKMYAKEHLKSDLLPKTAGENEKTDDD